MPDVNIEFPCKFCSGKHTLVLENAELDKKQLTIKAKSWRYDNPCDQLAQFIVTHPTVNLVTVTHGK